MDWISSLLLATVRLAIPVLLISLAELYGQRAGMVNIGLEGLASIGALVGFLVCYVTGSNWLGLLCGALAGVIVNMIYAFSTVTLCADHTVYGMAVNIFAPALASFIYRVYFGTGSDLKQITTMSSVAIPGLKDIPVLGPLLFDQSPMVYLTFLLVLFTAIFFGKTRAGLSYKAVGEHPQAAATLGIPVVGVKYLACVICGALSGIGGAYLTTCRVIDYIPEWRRKEAEAVPQKRPQAPVRKDASTIQKPSGKEKQPDRREQTPAYDLAEDDEIGMVECTVDSILDS